MGLKKFYPYKFTVGSVVLQDDGPTRQLRGELVSYTYSPPKKQYTFHITGKKPHVLVFPGYLVYDNKIPFEFKGLHNWAK